MKKIIIFGNGKIAEVVARVILDSKLFEIACFTCDAEFITSKEIFGIPVVDINLVAEQFPSNDYGVFVAIGYQNMNRLRAEKIRQVKEIGYKLISVVHPESGVFSDLELGENCFIMNNVNIHPGVKIGNNVFIWSGAVVGHHSIIGDNTWITSGVNISGSVEAGENCFFAINSTIGNNVRIGAFCFLGANTLLTKDLQNGAVLIAESSKPIRLNSDQFLRITMMK